VPHETINHSRLVLPVPAAGFDVSVDVAIAGGGAAGLTAALAARDSGAEAWVFERDSTPQGSTAMSQGAMMAAGSKSQAAHGVADHPDNLYRDILAKAEGGTDPVLARAVADNAGLTVDWLMEHHAIPIAFDPRWKAMSGHGTARLHGPQSGEGRDLIGALAQAAEAAGAQIITNARVTTLFAHPDGRVAGLEVTRPDGTTEAIGAKAVVLATCGFGANPDLIARHIPGMTQAIYWGHEGNDGWGILAGEALGGAAVDMTAYQGLGLLAHPYGVVVHPRALFEGGIEVNTDGVRFEDELFDVSGAGARILKQPGGIAWVVLGATALANVSDSSEFRQLLSLGAVKPAASIADLATIIGCPAQALADTVAQTNATIASGLPDRFGRSFGAVPLIEPPYAAVRITGALFHTQGGLAVDGRAQVLKPDGTPLPNLFAAGGTARGVTGKGPTGYLPGAGLGMAVTLGRLAGLGAAQVALS
jgi:fumarate reductase flavoprotein subunit